MNVTQLNSYAHNLICNYYTISSLGYELSLDDICDQDLNEFVLNYWEHDNRDLTFLTDSDKTDDILSNIVLAMKKDSKENQLNLSQSIMDSLLNYYRKSLQELIDKTLFDIEYNERLEAGHRRKQHSDNGEFYWSANQ